MRGLFSGFFHSRNAISHDDQMCWAATAANMLYYTNWNWSQTDIDYFGDSKFMVSGDFNGDGKEDILLHEQNSGWGDMNVRIETDTRISGSKFAISA
ncbi:MAG: hypothetical protein IKA32_11185 [Lentisphaeria bacterium]|nr:hypothetical protein [Lentisphaeria bacterium]